MLLQYRAAAWAGCVTQVFWGLIRLMIFEGFYRSTTSPQPISYPQIVSYIWLSQAMLALTIWNVDTDVRQLIREGTIAYELARPVDLYGFWYARGLAGRVAPAALRAGPILAVAAFLGLHAPASVGGGAAAVLAIAGAFLLAAAIATLATISLLWTLAGEGAARVLNMAVYLFSGLLLPMPLFPEWAQRILVLLPFRGLIDTPFRLYIGQMPLSEAPVALLHQWLWIVALVALGRGLLSRGLRRVVVQGG
jgi:ABC-2 type transport system permease protein